MLRLNSFHNFEWIKEETVRLDYDNEDGCRVSNLLPNRYSHYCKILHPIYRDNNIKDESLFYSDFAPPNVPLDFNYGERITFKDLAKKYHFHYTKEVSSSTLARLLGGYPRYLILGEEGTTDITTLRELVTVLKPFTNREQCYAHYDFLKIINECGDFLENEKGLLFYGKMEDVLSMYSEGTHFGRGSPTYWWAEDKSWCLHTDYDSDFSIFGGTKELIEVLMSNNELECIPVDLDTRIDDRANEQNLTLLDEESGEGKN